MCSVRIALIHHALIKHKEVLRQMMRCPNCNCRDIGKIGTYQYYCWGCFIELTVNGDKMSVFQVEQDGTLSSLDDIFYPEDTPAEVTVMGDRAVIHPQEALPVEAHETIMPVAQPMVGSLPS